MSRGHEQHVSWQNSFVFALLSVVQVDGLRVCGSLALGQMHGLATGFDGALYAWGTDDHGSLGQGEGAANWQSMPVKLPKVGCQRLSQCGSLCGQITCLSLTCGLLATHPCIHVCTHLRGHPPHTCTSLLQPVPGLRGVDIKAAACGWKHSLAVGTGGALHTWGWNGSYHTDISPAAGEQDGRVQGLG